MSADEESNRNVNSTQHGAVQNLLEQLKSKALIDPQKSDEEQVTTLRNTWTLFSSIADTTNVKDIMGHLSEINEILYRQTLFVLLSINWAKIHKIQKTALIAALENCANKLEKKNPDVALKCRILTNIISDPWDNTLIDFLNSTKQTVNGDSKLQPPTFPIINNQIVEYITSQPVEVLTTRLDILIERLNCFDLALNLARVCRKCLKDLSEDDFNLFFDYYVGLLYKFKLLEEFYQEVLNELTVEDGLKLLDRYSQNNSKAQILLKKHCIKKASHTILNHLVTKVLQSKKVVNSHEDHVFKVTKVWIRLNTDWGTQESELQKLFSQHGENASSTLHLYLMYSAIKSHRDPKFLKSDMLQIIIRRLNEGHNEVKKQIQAKDNLSQKAGPEVEATLSELKLEVLEAEHRLAEEFLLLGELLQDCAAAHRECLLTAFSLRPTQEGLQALEAVVPSEDTKENLGLLDLTAEAIECTTDVCDDLLIILNSARWQLLKWETKWEELKKICTEYMVDPDLFRYKKQELANAQVPVYCDYKVVHQDRLQRRNRQKDLIDEEKSSSGGKTKVKSEHDGPKSKRKRSESCSSSEPESFDFNIMKREVLVVSSGSEGDGSPDPKERIPISHFTVPTVKDQKPQITIPSNRDTVKILIQKQNNSSTVKDSAPCLAKRNLQPQVIIFRRVMKSSPSEIISNVIDVASMDNFTPASVNHTVQVVQVGQGVPPPQQNTTPAASQPPPEPPPPPQPPTNGPAASNASATEQLPKFQQVFGKSFQQQQQAPQQQPQAASQPSQQPTTPSQQPAPQQQQAVVAQPQQQPAQQQSRVVANQASLLRTATPIQITQSSLEALIQAHPQLASALAGREGKIMCFKQGSNIILTDKIRPDCQPGTSGLKRPVKRPPEAAPTPANSQLENELREFDAVLRSVKERDGSSSNSTRPEVAAAPAVVAAAPAATAATPNASSFSQPPPLAFNKTTTAASKPPAKKQPPPKTSVSASTSPNSSATTSPTSATTPNAAPKAATPTKTPPKTSVEDEQTQKRIYEILSEYTEQLRNSPDLNNKPAPRRRSNPPTNPSPKRKKKSKDADEHVPSEDSSSNLAQDSEEHDSVSESGSSLPAESPPALPVIEPPPQPPPTVIAIPVTQSKPLVLQRQLMVVGKASGQKLIRVIPANSGLRALTPTLLLQQMTCKPDQLINFQSVRSVKIPVMSTQALSSMAAQQQVVVPFQAQAVKKEQQDATLVEALWANTEAIKQEPEPIKVEPSEEEEEASAQSASDSPVPEAKSSPPRAKPSTKCPVTRADDKKRRLVRQDNMQKSLSEECEDLGVDAPSTSELFPDADLPFELSNNSDSSLSYLDTCQRRRNNGASELNGDAEDSGADSPKRRKVCLTRPFAALKSRKEDEAADTDGSVEGDETAKGKRAVKPRSSCACCGPAAPKAAASKKLNGKAGKKK